MNEYGFADVVYDFPEPQITWVKKDINALVLESQKKDRVNVVISTGTKMLAEIMPEVAENKAYTFISVKGGFSSINFIDYIAKKSEIDELTVTTLAVGRKHIRHLDKLPIKKAKFICSGIFEKRGLAKEYDYYDTFKTICENHGWEYSNVNNHSKVILMRSAGKKYVLETSSNLNENPKIEQFCFQIDEKLYDFYYEFFKRL